MRKRQNALVRKNRRLARVNWRSRLEATTLKTLDYLSEQFGFSIAAGDLVILDRGWYVTHAGLLGLARRNDCRGIRVQPLREFCDTSASRWVFKATVYKSSRSRGFVGFGDADPSNVNSVVRGAEMRVAETRAVNRALRKAYGIGLCSVEELGWTPVASSPTKARAQDFHPATPDPGNGRPRLRDRLCQLIRQHRLDPTLVKRYATNFCETANLREAGREKVEAFVNHLAEWAARDREALLTQLTQFADTQEPTEGKQ